ncbi:hypothetical protein FHR84_002586 [Actinopolyspora biskrensis]|uniref:Uncharacterized protein n=1 Tax=Actinopolyspora biskrensis TaxID=1470178 RepID=A0A852YZT0_9ACTN|nr:hypothetical protein [Actinopolyspora biskrensis]NYH79252.1 hypothetical protein [Actinopolyspora biskrensis]
MTRVPSKLLVANSALLCLVVLTFVNGIVSEHDSMLPDPVRWILLVLATALLLVSVGELLRRGARRGPNRQEH